MIGVAHGLRSGPRELARLAGPEIRDHLSRSRRILFPGGSTEQLGAQAPLGTDAILADTALYWLRDPLPPSERERNLGADPELHANIGETSALLAVDPGLVRFEQARAEFPELREGVPQAVLVGYLFVGQGVFRRIVPRPAADRLEPAESGVWGDPTRATPEIGRTYFGVIESAPADRIDATDAPVQPVRLSAAEVPRAEMTWATGRDVRCELC